MTSRIHSILAITLVAAVTAAACSSPGSEQDQQEAGGLWAAISGYASWEQFRGHEGVQPGKSPHGKFVQTFVNPAAGNSAAPGFGSIIVKENYKPDSTLAATTVMYKVEGYNPEHNDWFWLKRLADGTIEVEGRGQMCQSCHGARADNDYIMTAILR